MLGRMPSTVHALGCHDAQELVVTATPVEHGRAQPRPVNFAQPARACIAPWCMCSGIVPFEEVEV